MPRLPMDSESEIVQEEFAVIFTPRKQRGRFPENCVYIQPDAETAVAKANPNEKLYAAKVTGPCRSSEGFRLFYLVRWLS